MPVALAAGARSVDHLSMIHPDDIAPLAAAQCAAVLLPAAEFMGAEHRAPARLLLEEGAIVVLASDANPGTAPVFSMPLILGLGARMYGMSARETLAAATLNAAWTLGLEHTWARSRSASAPTCCCWTGRWSGSPTGSATTRWRWCCSAASRCTSATPRRRREDRAAGGRRR